ncbi:MAG: succinylglutamate desuccinylase/aspartoacylase family protein [Sphingomonadales bacterium]
MAPRSPFIIDGTTIPAGGRATVRLDIPGQSTMIPMSMPVHVIHGRREGPVLFVSAAIHGDEINGVEIIRQLLRRSFRGLKGTLIAVPTVNVYGFINPSRYLPDGRDLNRSFPGRPTGSLASRLAHRFTTEILFKCTHGIDLHTGGGHRTNHPHVRANLDDGATEAMAQAFATPVIINANLRDGSLRQAAAENGVKMLLYEAGGALRFDDLAIRAGLRGVVNVMRHLGMLAKRRGKTTELNSLEARSSSWVRSPAGGIFRSSVPLGSRVGEGQLLGRVSDTLGETGSDVMAPFEGLVIGRILLPVVNEGDALFHLARFHDPTEAAAAVEAFHEEHLEGLGEGDFEAKSE